MAIISTLHSFVYLGNDANVQPELTEEIKSRIFSVKDNIKDTINFVNKLEITQSELEKMEVSLFADTISYFIGGNLAVGSGICGYYENTLLFQNINHPKKVIEYLYSITDSYWQNLRTSDIKIQEQTLKYLKQNMFLDILQKTIEHFKGQNIYGIKNSEIANPERRDEIYQFAFDNIKDKKRIINSQLLDGIFDLINIKYPNIADQEMIYGNAAQFIIDTKQDLIIEQKRNSTKILSDLKATGYYPHLKDTKIIIGGEYYNNGVLFYARLLECLGFPGKNITLDSRISIEKSKS